MVSMCRALAVAVLLAMAIFIVSSAAAWAATSPGIAWEKTYDIHGNDRGWSMEQTDDGGYIMVGTSDDQACLAKVDANGTMEWKNTYSFGGTSKGYSVRQADDGGYIVAGTVRKDSKDSVLLMKAAKNGSELWNKTYGSSSAGDIEGAGTSVRQTSDGGYVIAAQFPYPTTNNVGIYLIKTDASGNMQRNVMIGKNADVTYPSIEQTSDGGYIVAATIHTKGAQPGYDLDLVKFDSSGSTKWEKTIGGAGDQYGGHDGSVKQAPDGGYIIAGENGGAYLVKADSSGNVLWSKQYNNSTKASSVALAGDGGYVLAGTSDDGRMLLIKTGSSGDEEWSETAGTGACEALAVQKTSDDGYAIFGTSGSDLCLVKLNAPAKTDKYSVNDNGGLFPGFGNLFGNTIFGGSSVDEGQVDATKGSLFNFPSFNSFGDTTAGTTGNTKSLFDITSMPSFGFDDTRNAIETSPFGNMRWPFS